MPLMKKSSEGTTVGTTHPPLPPLTPSSAATTATMASKKLGGTREAGTKAAAPMTKDSYWERKEARDIETGIRIRRSGVWQAALQSVGLLQLNTSNTLADFLALVEKAADAGLVYVNKGDK